MSCLSLAVYTPIQDQIVVTLFKKKVTGSSTLGAYTTPSLTLTTTVPIPFPHFKYTSMCVGGTSGWTSGAYTVVDRNTHTHQWSTSSGGTSTTTTTTGIGTFTVPYGYPIVNNCKTKQRIIKVGSTTTTTQNEVVSLGKVPGIQIWPTLTFVVSADLDIEFQSNTSIVLPPPPSKVVFARQILITVSNFTISIPDTDISITIPISETIVVGTNSLGKFYTEVYLPDAPYIETTTINSAVLGDVTYGFSINPYFVLCANPTPPSSCVNFSVQIAFNLSFENLLTINIPGFDIGSTVTYSNNISITCPMPMD